MKSKSASGFLHPTVSVVLNVFKRSKNLPRQLEAIYAQTIPVSEILIWENGEEGSPAGLKVKRARSDHNLGVWARFAFALNAESEFVWIIDDDVIPGPGWLESALITHSATGGLVGSRGLRFKSNVSYTLYDEFGPNGPNDELEEVDIVGHNWIFPRAWLGVFWSEIGNKFQSILAGEDIHLSFSIQKHLEVGTYVPPHPTGNRNIWGEQPASEAEFGRESLAISQSKNSLKRFEQAYAHYINQGFQPLCGRSVAHRQKTTDLALGSLVRFSPKLAHDVARFLRIRK